MDKENIDESELIAEKIETIEYIFTRVASQTLSDNDEIEMASEIIGITLEAMGLGDKLLNERTISAVFKMVSDTDSLAIRVDTLRNLGTIQGTSWDGKIYNELIKLRDKQIGGVVHEVINDRLKILRINELNRIAKLAKTLT